MTSRPRTDDPSYPDPAPGGDGVRLSTDVARKILSAVNGLSYGSVEIVVHEARVVQIERRERVRLDGVPASQACKSPGRSHHTPNQAKSNPQEDPTSS